MAISINDWVKQQKFNYYYIMLGLVSSSHVSKYVEIKQWLTSSTITGKCDMRTVRPSENNAIVGGIGYLSRCIVLFEKEADCTLFILRWS